MDTIRHKIKSLRNCVWFIIACLLVNLSQTLEVRGIELTQNVEYKTETAQTGVAKDENAACGQIIDPDVVSYALKICNNTTTVETGDIIEFKLTVGMFGQIDEWDLPRIVSAKTISNTGSASLSPIGTQNSWGYGSNTTTLLARVNSTGTLGNVIIRAGGAVVARTFTGSNISAGNTIIWKPTGNNAIINGINANTEAINDLKETEETWREEDENSNTEANEEAQEATDAAKTAIEGKQGLLSLFYDLIRALTSTNQTNCNIRFHDPASNTTQTINICQGTGTPILTMIQTGASILATIWCAKAGIAWYNRFVAELNEVSK